MANFGVPKDGLAPGDMHVLPALKGNPQSQYSLMTFDFVNDPGMIVDWKRVKRMHRFMHKKRRPLMTRRARRKMVR